MVCQSFLTNQESIMLQEIDPLNRDVFYTDYIKSDLPEDNGESSAKFFTRLCKVLKKPVVIKDGAVVEDAIIGIEPVEYVEIIAKKFKDIHIAKAQEADKERFATAYAAFKKAQAAKAKIEPKTEELEKPEKKVANK